MDKLSYLRDLHYAQDLDYPTLDVTIDRLRAGEFGLTMQQIAKSLVTATASSRFVEPNYWRDPVSGNAFQIQVEIPQHRMGSRAELEALPVMKDGALAPQLRDLADIQRGKAPGLVERYNMQRVVSLTANIHERRSVLPRKIIRAPCGARANRHAESRSNCAANCLIWRQPKRA